MSIKIASRNRVSPWFYSISIIYSFIDAIHGSASVEIEEDTIGFYLAFVRLFSVYTRNF